MAVKAVGLLTTKLPDGSKGYSLVILLTAEGFAPILVGLGFTSTGISRTASNGAHGCSSATASRPAL
ncbi:MAG: hypothetical protein MRJ92_11015 [Nitrospira sp.]|nr:hypothetical protein [Nitrospira sp.]